MARQMMGAIRQVVGFLVQGIEFEADGWRAFENEMKDLIAPHMAVLVHRRTKLLDGSDGARWSDELDTFMRQNLWPLLGDERDYADRNRTFVTLMLDVAIAEEQRRASVAHTAVMPMVSRFDAAWAG
ncbi:MAG TPA: hypothetical protein VHZ78_05560 [Rhizomicrobium sp.]|nr:hypothetical protein [Rhizomicrobium sp.]